MTYPLTGILGGTFDPVHIGHQQLARVALEALRLDVLRCVPAGQPAHRAVPEATAAQRLAMVQRAFAGEARYLVDAAETTQTGPSWTIRTLERLRAALPETALVLIVGADAFLGLPDWQRWQSLIDYAHIAVANRPGVALHAAQMPAPLAALWQARHTTQVACLRDQPAGLLVSFDMPPCPVSATQIRALRRAGQPITGLVCPAVEDYIQQQHLYAQPVG